MRRRKTAEALRRREIFCRDSTVCCPLGFRREIKKKQLEKNEKQI
ncbi:hypothetical protein ACFL4T_02485 [candidate division KSB1 bacterium]